MTYSEKLKDPRWQKKRLEVFERDNWACFFCGCKHETLHVHHFKYTGEPWEADDGDLCTACESCHEIEHLKPKLNSLELKLFDLIRFTNAPNMGRLWFNSSNKAENEAVIRIAGQLIKKHINE